MSQAVVRLAGRRRRPPYQGAPLLTGYDAAKQVLAAGYARRRLRPHERAALNCLRSIAGRFFAGDSE